MLDWTPHVFQQDIFLNNKLSITIIQDKTPFHFGTKLRKAIGIYKTLCSKSIDTIVIYGNPNSNYIACFSTYFQSKGFKVISVFYSKSNYKSLNYWISLKNSNQVFFVNSKTDQENLLSTLQSEYFVIPAYGVCLESLLEVWSLWEEIEWNNIRTFVLDVGSGITLLSLLHYLETHSIDSVSVIGICIGRKKERLACELNTLSNTLLQKDINFSRLELFNPTLDARFGKYSTFLLEYSKSLVSQGILLEPIYSAKSLYTLENLICSKHISLLRNVFYLHQGGILPFYKNFIDYIKL